MLYVLAYPVLDPPAAEAIGIFRQRHEPARAALVAAHFTLVFGVRGVRTAELVRHAGAIAEAEAPFAVSLDRCETFAEADGSRKLLLMAGEGQASLRRLHAGLYGGLLQNQLRSDLRFDPHVTVATAADNAALASAWEEAKALDLPISGTLAALTVAELAADGLRHHAEWPLGRAAPAT